MSRTMSTSNHYAGVAEGPSAREVLSLDDWVLPPASHIDKQTKEGYAEGQSPLDLSIVVPVFNESEAISEFHRRLVAVLDSLNRSVEIIYVNDGSVDASLQCMHALRVVDSRVAILNLSRNFGKEVAVTAGLDHASGAAVVIIDADLQDPPELIPLLVEKWSCGYDMVTARRRGRRGETWLKRATAQLFYRLIGLMAEMPIPADTGDFRVLSRRCLEALASCHERRRFMKGLFAWIGFRHVEIFYDRDPRFAGTTKWNYWRLWNFAIEGITSFTITPLKLSTYLGLVTALAAIVYAAFIVVMTLMLGRAVPGYASLMVVILLLAGVQLIAIGVIGEYVGRIFMESKGRPLYFIDGYLRSRPGTDSGEHVQAGVEDQGGSRR